MKEVSFTIDMEKMVEALRVSLTIQHGVVTIRTLTHGTRDISIGAGKLSCLCLVGKHTCARRQRPKRNATFGRNGRERKVGNLERKSHERFLFQAKN